MSPRKGESQKPVLPPGGVLDWSRGGHWSSTLARCRYCPGLTNMRDSKGKPAHKLCAEQAIAEQVAEAQAAYENERLPPK